MHLCVSVCLCVYLKSNSLDMFEGRTTLTKCTSFCIAACICVYACLDIPACLHIHDVCGCMIVQMQHIVIHTLSTKYGVALHQCMCVVSTNGV